MTIPERIIALLGISGAVLILVRMVISRMDKKRYGNRYAGFETGSSKTIGDRETQEDEFGTAESEDGIMAVLADGMGKQYGGKIASRIAVEVFLDIFQDANAYYNPQYSFRKAFQGANREILNQLEDNQGFASVGTVMIKNRKLYYAVVGDVKAAVYRNHELVPVTFGHTISVLAHQKYKEGKLSRQEAIRLLEHHRLYNYVGQDGFHDIEFFDTPIALYGGEYVLLMSNGLYEAVKWKDMEDCLEREGSCQKKAFELIELVNQSQEEDKDNAAVVVIKIR